MNTPISPKVIWPVVVYFFLSSVETNISSITPQMLGFLGPWEPFVFGTVNAVVAGFIGWYVKDSLRSIVSIDPTPTGPAPEPFIPAAVKKPVVPPTGPTAPSTLNVIPMPPVVSDFPPAPIVTATAPAEAPVRLV